MLSEIGSEVLFSILIFSIPEPGMKKHWIPDPQHQTHLNPVTEHCVFSQTRQTKDCFLYMIRGKKFAGKQTCIFFLCLLPHLFS